jgi:hypothetical protein
MKKFIIYLLMSSLSTIAYAQSIEGSWGFHNSEASTGNISVKHVLKISKDSTTFITYCDFYTEGFRSEVILEVQSSYDDSNYIVLEDKKGVTKKKGTTCRAGLTANTVKYEFKKAYGEYWLFLGSGKDMFALQPVN